MLERSYVYDISNIVYAGQALEERCNFSQSAIYT